MKGHLMLATVSLQSRTGSGEARKTSRLVSLLFLLLLFLLKAYLIVLGMKSNLSSF